MAEKQHRGGIKGGIATDDNNKAKAIAAIPMAGAIVTAALLLSGVSLIGSYQQPVIAQQNMTGGGGGGGGGDDGITTTTDNATTSTTTTMSGAAQGGNATNATSAGGGGNQSTSEVRMNIEQAHMALQNNDTQSALMYLDMALSALGADGAEEDSECGGVTVGGTSAADDYGCPPDPDY